MHAHVCVCWCCGGHRITGSQGLNSFLQGWQQPPFPTKPPCQPSLCLNPALSSLRTQLAWWGGCTERYCSSLVLVCDLPLPLPPAPLLFDRTHSQGILENWATQEIPGPKEISSQGRSLVGASVDLQDLKSLKETSSDSSLIQALHGPGPCERHWYRRSVFPSGAHLRVYPHSKLCAGQGDIDFLVVEGSSRVS